MEINDEVDLNAVEEQVRNATDMFGDIAHFIDTEAKDYRKTTATSNSTPLYICDVVCRAA